MIIAKILWEAYLLTPRSSRPSSCCLGIMVTSSISQTKATSGGVRPVGRGSAMIGDFMIVVVEWRTLFLIG